MRAGMIYESLDLQKLITEVGAKRLVEAMLDNIGNTNSLIRENILGINYRLAVEGLLEHKDYIDILNTCLGMDYLFKNINDPDCDDAVFCRAYASLAIGWIVHADAKMEFLSESQYKQALETTILYMMQETDRKGYVLGKGWVHAIAHGATMLREMINHPKFPMEYAEKILDCIKFHIASQHPFTDGEEHRFASLVLILMDKGITEQQTKDWMGNLAPKIKAAHFTDEHASEIRLWRNVEYFLRSLVSVLAVDTRHDSLMRDTAQYVSKIWSIAQSND